LDNSTTGLLYFAKNKDIKKEYKELQKEWRVNKYYIAEVYWDIRYRIRDNWNVIEYPIAHHKFSKDRMVVVLPNTDSRKIDTRLHRVKTKILECFYDEDKQITTLTIIIQKWIRHQIRSHLSSIWYPIVWDEIYWKKKDPRKWDLQLFSIWLSVMQKFTKLVNFFYNVKNSLFLWICEFLTLWQLGKITDSMKQWIFLQTKKKGV
jgi:23S rRNA-/tRNA-specific pseudouridylate synthase